MNPCAPLRHGIRFARGQNRLQSGGHLWVNSLRRGKINEVSSREQKGRTIFLPRIHLTTLKIKIWREILGISEERSVEALSGDIERGSLILESCSSQVSTP
jgi:hypothetical protein